jgi:hypothetical protein
MISREGEAPAEPFFGRFDTPTVGQKPLHAVLKSVSMNPCSASVAAIAESWLYLTPAQPR